MLAAPRRYTPAMLRPSSLLCFVLLLLAGCDQLKAWRNGQVRQMHQLAQGSKVTPPAQPVSVPDSVKDELPLDPTFTVLSYSGSSGSATLTALSPWDGTKTAEWLVARLGQLGYDSGDNASRILDGATYQKSGGAYHSLYVKLSLNTAEQCTVEYRAGP
jgi:hypothetical protein